MTATGSGKNRGKCRRERRRNNSLFFLSSLCLASQANRRSTMPSDAHRSLLGGDSASESDASVRSGLSMPQLRDAGAAPAAAAASRGSRSGSSRWARAKRTTRTTRVDADKSPRARSGSGGQPAAPEPRECAAARCSTPGGLLFQGGQGRRRGEDEELEAGVFFFWVFAFFFAPDFFVFLKNLSRKTKKK